MKNSDKIPELIQWITRRGVEIKPGFIILPEQEKYYLNLYCYCKGIECEWDLKKGLLITGNIGTGKTLSMKIMRGIFKNFGIINTRYIVREYFAEKVPTKIIDKYGRESFKKNNNGHLDKGQPFVWCFDDFGLENVNVKNFGNEQNIMEEIFLDRYDMFNDFGMKTYATTNLTSQMIEDNYGKRVRDRLKECMNYVTLTGESKRK